MLKTPREPCSQFKGNGGEPGDRLGRHVAHFLLQGRSSGTATGGMLRGPQAGAARQGAWSGRGVQPDGGEHVAPQGALSSEFPLGHGQMYPEAGFLSGLH